MRQPHPSSVFPQRSLLTVPYRDRLRCDRQQPCHNCLHRGLAETCTYVHAHAKVPRSTTSHSDASPLSSPTVRDRVRQLEDQVVSLLGALNGNSIPVQAGSYPGTSSAHQSSPSNSEGPSNNPLELAPPVPDCPGYMEYTTSAVNYVGNSHWLAILGNVGRATRAKV